LKIAKEKQSGLILLEALIGVLIFSIGIVGMLGLQSLSIKASTDANYRSEASYLANQILGQMWLDKNNLSAYSLNAGNAPCAAGSSASANPNVTGWLGDVARLPSANQFQQQIIVAPANNQVSVTVCWQTPHTTTAHNFVASTSIN